MMGSGCNFRRWLLPAVLVCLLLSMALFFCLVIGMPARAKREAKRHRRDRETHASGEDGIAVSRRPPLSVIDIDRQRTGCGNGFVFDTFRPASTAFR